MSELPHHQLRRPPLMRERFLAEPDVGKKIEKYQKHQEIFAQGEVADTVFYIQKGKVKVTVLSEQGKEAVIGILAQGQFFGEGCLDGAKLRVATTRAMEECLLTSLTKAAMIAALEAEPKFSALFVSYLLSRNNRIEEDLVDQLFNSSERRLARLLLLLADFGKEGAKPVAVTLSQEVLGRYDRHHPIPRQLFHEQVSEKRPHQLQRKDRGPSFAA